MYRGRSKRAKRGAQVKGKVTKSPKKNCFHKF